MIIQRMACLVGLLWILGSIPAQATCTGSGQSFSCPAGASISDVQNALNSASDGATITFANGSYSWSSTAPFSASKGATLICASVQGCTINLPGTGNVLGLPTITGTNSHLYRISGFVFNSGTSSPIATGVIWFGYAGYSNGVLTQVRIDHNSFANFSEGSIAIFFGDNDSASTSYGVIDHNTLNSSGAVTLLQMIGSVQSSPAPSSIGTANNMFVENNTVNWSHPSSASIGGCMDSWGDARIVWRNNTTSNCLTAAHGVTHAGGPSNIEFYNNTVTMNSGSVTEGTQDCYRCFHHQGSGEFIAFNNSFTAYSGKNSEVISMAHYRDYPNGIDGGLPANAAQCNGAVSGLLDALYVVDGNRSPDGSNQGYPCWRQPGRDVATGKLKPMYVWNNYWSDTKAQVLLKTPDMGGSPDYYSNHMQANRDWYNSVSASAQTSPTAPFNGGSGMGFGTLANRPTSCTTNPNESGGGVGYFATDQGPQGTLYQCSAANTWAVWYTPFTYPHPLTGGAQGGPNPPAGLQATIQ